jgi:hypothetical protein
MCATPHGQPPHPPAAPVAATAMAVLLAVVREVHAGTATPAELEAARHAGLRRLAGGRNSGVYAGRLCGRDLCLKLPVVDERGRAEREWRALLLLAAELPGLGPAPLLHDPQSTQPVVVLSLLPGQHLGARRLDRQLSAMLAEVHIRLHAIRPDPGNRSPPRPRCSRWPLRPG